MRRHRIIAIGLAGLSVFGSLTIAETASAEVRRVCQDHYKILWSGISAQCTAATHCRSYPIQGGLGFRNCFDVDVPPKPTTPWQGSASGYGKTVSSSTALHQR